MMRASFLRSRWLYVLLGLVIGLLYMRFFSAQHVITSFSSEPASQQAASSEAVRQMELGPEQLLRAGRTHPVALGLLCVLGLTALGLGVSGLVLGARAWRRRVARRRRASSLARLPHRWSITDLGRVSVLLACVALLLPFVHIGLVSLGWMSPDDLHVWGLVSTVVIELVLLLLVWAFASTTAVQWRRMFGLTRARAWWGVWRGLRGYVIAFPWIMALLWAAASLAQALGIEPDAETIQDLLFVETRGPIRVLTLVVACVVGPIAEEVFFRGLLFSSLRRHLSRAAAMLISATLFSALHTNVVGFIPILALGCVLADLYERTGSLAAPITVHITHNALLVGAALAVRALMG